MLANQTKTCEIVLNGEPRIVPGGLTVSGLLDFLEIVPDRVAVELDARIVRKAEWIESPIVAGSRVEIVQFVGGG